MSIVYYNNSKKLGEQLRQWTNLKQISLCRRGSGQGAMDLVLLSLHNHHGSTDTDEEVDPFLFDLCM